MPCKRHTSQVAALLLEHDSTEEEIGSDYEASDDDSEVDNVSNVSEENDSTNSEELPADTGSVAGVNGLSYLSKNKNETWHSVPPSTIQGRRNARNVLREREGCTTYARNNVTNVM